jgi:outer membrane lipase/esterase
MKFQKLCAQIKRAITPVVAVAFLLTLSIPVVAQAAAGGIPATPDHNPPFSAIYVIGDSLSDTGRTSAVLSQPGFPFPPPPYATGRISNGPVWIEYLAPQVRRPYNALENFSWAGANTGTFNVFGAGLPGMLNELGELLTLTSGSLDPKALYVVFGGANDFFRIFNGADPATVIASGVTNLLTIVVTLRTAGAENIVVIDLPDIGRTPRAIAGGPASAAGATFLSTTFNTLLNHALDGLNFPVVRVSTFDLINQFVAQPKKFGFTNVTGQGILDLANADTYLFWDDVHPTTRGHRYVADEVFHALARAGKLGHSAK